MTEQLIHRYYWHFGQDNSLSWSSVLCIAGCLAVYLLFINCMPVALTPHCENWKYLQVWPDVSWGAWWPLVEYHGFRYSLKTYPNGSSYFSFHPLEWGYKFCQYSYVDWHAAFLAFVPFKKIMFYSAIIVSWFFNLNFYPEHWFCY